jgi:hypothetical protein
VPQQASRFVGYTGLLPTGVAMTRRSAGRTHGTAARPLDAGLTGSSPCLALVLLFVLAPLLLRRKRRHERARSDVLRILAT